MTTQAVSVATSCLGNGVRENETDGRRGANCDQNYQRGKSVVDGILKLRVVRAARVGRGFEGASKNKYRQIVKNALGFKLKSVEGRFENDRLVP